MRHEPAGTHRRRIMYGGQGRAALIRGMEKMVAPVAPTLGPMARTVADTALILSVIAGPDDRAPLSYDVDTRQFHAATRRPSVKEWRVAWTPDLGYARVDPAVLELCGDAAAEFETLGCHVEVVNPGWENPEDAFATLIAAQFYAAWSDRLPDAEPAK